MFGLAINSKRSIRCRVSHARQLRCVVMRAQIGKTATRMLEPASSGNSSAAARSVVASRRPNASKQSRLQ
jgi:hypothetical protein